jgi:prepilin-type N-terminal cleavage/methylation domain-containing protein
MRLFIGLKTKPTNQRGFTLLETMVALCITGFVALAVVTTIYQLQAISNSHYAHITAVKQLENALHYLIRDVQSAQNPTAGTQVSFPLTLSWKSWEDNVQHQVTYSLDGSGNLTRNDGTHTSTVAKFIDTANDNTHWSYDSGGHNMTIVLTCTVHSGSKQASETRNIQIIPRPGS